MPSPNSTPLIEVRASPVHGRGVYALRKLPRGTLIGIYEGRRYSAEALLEVDWDRRHQGLTYLFALSDGTSIDGGEGGNGTRFLNHACSPNCQAVEVADELGQLRLELVTLKAVRSGEELFLDYRLSIDENASATDYPCRCGLPACRGTMAALARAPD